MDLNTNELNNTDESIMFEGYASVFGVVDQDSDQIAAGAFSEYLSNSQNENLLVLWEHDSSNPLGQVFSMYEDNHGLYISGVISSQTERGWKLLELLKKGLVKGLSVGYIAKEYEIIGNIRHITKADLIEISIVTLPSNPMAKINIITQDNVESDNISMQEGEGKMHRAKLLRNVQTGRNKINDARNNQNYRRHNQNTIRNNQDLSVSGKIADLYKLATRMQNLLHTAQSASGGIS